MSELQPFVGGRKKLARRAGLMMALLVDDEAIYSIKRARVGTFQGIAYPDYPHRSANATGGRMER